MSEDDLCLRSQQFEDRYSLSFLPLESVFSPPIDPMIHREVVERYVVGQPDANKSREGSSSIRIQHRLRQVYELQLVDDSTTTDYCALVRNRVDLCRVVYTVRST